MGFFKPAKDTAEVSVDGGSDRDPPTTNTTDAADTTPSTNAASDTVVTGADALLAPTVAQPSPLPPPSEPR